MDNKIMRAGNNELEIVKFRVGGVLYGVNVAKVDSIIMPIKVTEIPNVHPSIKGIINYRDTVISTIAMRGLIDTDEPYNPAEEKFIVLNFSNKNLAIIVDSVVGINRLTWEDIKDPATNTIGNSPETPLVGIVNIEGEELVLLLDFETILARITGSAGLKGVETNDSPLTGYKIAIADDSKFLLSALKSELEKLGASVNHFSNGKECLDHLLEAKDKDFLAVITDVEMPVMDGYTLAKSIKTNKDLNHLYVVLFSSIVSDSTNHRTVESGADIQITKPELAKLSDIIISKAKEGKI